MGFLVPWPLWPPLMPTTAMAVMAMAMVDTVLATAVAMDTERGLLMPSPLLLLRLSLRLMLKLIMATEDTVVMEATVDTALAAMVATDTERGPLMPMPTTAMADMPATAVAMDTDMERGQLTLMPMLMAMADTALAM